MRAALLLLVVAWDAGFAMHLGFGAGGAFVLSTVGVAAALMGGAAVQPAIYVGRMKLASARLWPAHLGLCVSAALPFLAAAVFR